MRVISRFMPGVKKPVVVSSRICCPVPRSKRRTDARRLPPRGPSAARYLPSGLKAIAPPAYEVPSPAILSVLLSSPDCVWIILIDSSFVLPLTCVFLTARKLPSGLNAIEPKGELVSTFSVAVSLPVAMSITFKQRTTLPPLSVPGLPNPPPTTMKRPSGLMVTRPLWSSAFIGIVRTSRPVATSQILTESMAAETWVRPSRLNATAVGEFWWPASEKAWFPVAIPHNRTWKSSAAEAIHWPSGLIATAFTFPEWP